MKTVWMRHTLPFSLAALMVLISMCKVQSPESNNEGAKLYQDHCATCHGSDLTGGMAQGFLDGVWQFGDGRSYPNPARGMLNIEFQGPGHPDIALEIYDALGRKIMAREFYHVGGMVESVDVSGMLRGVYYLKIRMDKQQATRKILIE